MDDSSWTYMYRYGRDWGMIAGAVLLTIAVLATFKYVQAPVVSAVASTTPQQMAYNPFDTLSLTAKAAYVYDLDDNKLLYSESPTQTLPLASLTKIIMADTALDILPQSATVPITANALAADGDSGLLLGEQWSFPELLKFTLLVSSNDGAGAIAEAAGALLNASSTDAASTTIDESTFVAAMNAKAASLGLTSMYFNNPSGLDVDTAISGGYGSAEDVASLFAYTLRTHPDILGITAFDKYAFKSFNMTHNVVNTDEAIDNIPGIVASKTGYTDLAGGNLAVIFDVGVGHPVVAVVLGSTFDGRFSDMLDVASTTIHYFSLQN